MLLKNRLLDDFIGGYGDEDREPLLTPATPTPPNYVTGMYSSQFSKMFPYYTSRTRPGITNMH